ncbi:MAG: adenylate/guanylate cyclase domain-containing protein [Planctomycetota bacterium]|jgi:class 3 adenylate cyclase/ActR/RegA family two-component response regulator
MSNILIVDDRDDILKSYKMGLKDAQLDWEILTAKNEKEAELLLKKHSFDIVITDLVMITEQSGMDVLKLARKKDPLVMVIIVTAYEKMLDRYKAFELGAFDCIARNTPGIKTIEEVIAKTKTALQFRQMTLGEIENQKKLTFMKRYFDPNVFGIIQSKPELLNISPRTVTVLFSDIRGFSGLCEILKEHPTLVSGFLREHFEESSKIIFDNAGVVDKFIGDAVMAIFGAFNSKEDQGKEDAINAIRASMKLREKYTEILEKWMEEWRLYTPHAIEVGLGIGIHTGEALVGNVGTETRDQFTALGPHVNFAQRMESRAEGGQILVSGTTKARIEHHFILNKVDSVSDVKNIPGSFDIFEVIKSISMERKK